MRKFAQYGKVDVDIDPAREECGCREAGEMGLYSRYQRERVLAGS